MSGPGVVILLVEDDPDDVFFVEEAFKAAAPDITVRVARDGEEAISYLLGEDARAERLALVLLDLKLPRKSGLEVLERCRRKPGADIVPMIVLTSSQSDADIRRAYELGANSYLVKPIDSDAQVAMIKSLLAYWLGFNKVPKTRLASE